MYIHIREYTDWILESAGGTIMKRKDGSDSKLSQDRVNLLADVAEMYYLEGKDQSQIAQTIGVTRSMISRMLSEARSRGIVEIRVARPVKTRYDLEQALNEKFALKDVSVISTRSTENEESLQDLGRGGAQVLKRYLLPGAIVGLAWGTSISATINALDIHENISAKVVQLVGAMGARNAEYDGHRLVQRLAEKLGEDGYFINAPFICQTPELAKTLLETHGVIESVELGKKATVALLGIGSTIPQYSSYFLAGYVPIEEIENIRAEGAVGVTAGIHFDLNGNIVCKNFYDRLVTIRVEHLLKVPVRIGVACGLGKVEPILGALRGKLVNVLVTDSDTAQKVLDQGKKV